MGPVLDLHGVVVNKEKGYSLISNQLMLHCYYENEDIHSVSLHFDYSLLSTTNVHTIRCFYSTQRNGYLYNLTDPQLITTYQYTNECISVVCSDLLYCLTVAGN